MGSSSNRNYRVNIDNLWIFNDFNTWNLDYRKDIFVCCNNVNCISVWILLNLFVVPRFGANGAVGATLAISTVDHLQYDCQ